MAYFERENRELVNLDSCDLLHSQFAILSDYAAGVSLDYLAEVSEQILPAHEPNEKYLPPAGFRVGAPALPAVPRRSGARSLTSLSGRSSSRACSRSCTRASRVGLGSTIRKAPSGRSYRRGMNGSDVSSTAGGLRTRANSSELSLASRELAREILRKPVAESQPEWSRETAADLRRFLQQQIESHIERRLVTVPVLEAA